MSWDVIIIGAGLSGLTCGRLLHQQGYRVLVLEKSRGLGGRLATRRFDSVPIDHGCRFLEPTTPQLEALITELSQSEILVPWQPQVYLLETGTLSPQPPAQPMFVAPAGMTAVAKHLAQDIAVQRQTRAVALKVGPQARWQAIAETSDQAIACEARCVVIAVPAPQAADLLGRTETAKGWQPLLETVTYAPCLSVMAGFASEAAVGPGDSPAGWIVWGDGAIAYAALDSAKPGRSGRLGVIQSSADFASHYLDSNYLDEAGHVLIEAAAPILGDTRPLWQQVHRWRYSLVGHSLDTPSPTALSISAALPLVCCGDWCGGKTASAAIASGQEAARLVHARLQSMGI